MFLMNYLLKYGFQAKRKSVNVKVLQIIIKMVKHISYDVKGKFDRVTCKPNQKWNSDKCQFRCKKHPL